MDDKPLPTELGAVARTTQIIVVALAVGAGVFLVLVLTVFRPAQQGPGQILTMMSAGLAVLEVVMHLIVPGLIVKSARGRIAAGTWRPSPSTPKDKVESLSDEEKLAAVFQTKTIVATALLQGAVFFALVAHLIEGRVLSLVVAATLMVGMLLHFPTAAKFARWVVDQSRLVEEEKQLRK